MTMMTVLMINTRRMLMDAAAGDDEVDDDVDDSNVDVGTDICK